MTALMRYCNGMDILKTCTKCKRELTLICFWKDVTRKGGLRSECKNCGAENNAEYRAKNPEKIKQKYAEYHAKNIEKIKQKNAEYRAKNSEKVKQSTAKWRGENPERDVEYRAKNTEKIKQRAVEYNALSSKALSDSYVKNRLATPGLSSTTIAPQLIEAKRWHLKLKRLLKETT